MIVTLIALELAQIPLAWSLARRVRRGQAEREALLHRAIEASEVERRRIARDLHDGVVQNLAGVSYSLSAAAEQIRETAPQAATAMVVDAAEETRQSMRELRSLLVDIYPPALQRAGLSAALCDLLAPLNARNVYTELDIQTDLELSSDTERILYRTAQEALRNVANHADARRVRVFVGCENACAVLAVADDGQGFDQAGTRNGTGSRHFGLRMLHDLAGDTDGELTIDSAPGAGTRLRMRLPIR